MSLTKIGSIGINTGIAFAGVTTIVTLNTANDALSIGATVNVGSGITLGASGDIFATGVSTFSGNLKVGSGVTISPDGDGFYTGVVTATTFSGALAASSLTGALPAISAANLTNVPAANITGTLPAISGANLTNLDASDLASGTVPTARLGSGTASSSTFLRGDSTFAAVTSTTINSNTNNYLITGTGTANVLQGESGLTFDGSDLTLQSQYFFIKAPDGGTRFFFGETQNDKSAQLSLYDTTDSQKVRIAAGDGSSDTHSFFNGGNLLIGSNSSAGTDYKLESYSGGAYNILAKSTNGNGGYHNFTGQASNGTITSYISHNGRGYFEDGVQFDSSGESLNSYEEGTFTPAYDAGGGVSFSYPQQYGFYTKIGDKVTFELYLQAHASSITSGNGGNGVIITGLPFTAHSHSRYYPAVTIGRTYFFQLDDNKRLYAYVQSGNSYIRLIQEQNDTAGSLFTAQQLDHNTCEILVSGHYRV